MASKNPKNCCLRLLLFGLLLFTAGISIAQESAQDTYLRSYHNGTQLYNSSRWQEAAVEFRRAQESAVTLNDWAQALYWVILSELAYSDYGSALRDMDELEKHAPNSSYTRDMLYHRARIYFNLGYFSDSLFLFRRYIDSVPDTDPESSDRIAAAFFWMGECLYAMGQYNEAEKFYLWVIERYPESQRVEVSTYRLDLIKHKKIEAELLALLQWSHEETLRTSEEFQRTLRTYEFTLNAYQRRIAELTQEGSPVIQEQELPLTDTVNEDFFLMSYESLLERARRLSLELELIISNYISGGPH
jgi:TolA-binding protein